MKNSSEKRKLYLIIGIVTGAIALICIIFLIVEYFLFLKEVEENAVRLENLAVNMTIYSESGETSKTENEEKKSEVEDAGEGNEKDIPFEPMHDFDGLKQINQDIYAWIQIPDTQVNYPVLQSSTDNKYLDINIDGVSSVSGSIYSNACNSKEFDDYITVLYGHNMKSGEMFGSLHNFDEKEFFDNFETYTVETSEARFCYSVYAAVNYNDSLIPDFYDVKSPSGRDKFIQSLENCRGNSITHFRDEIEISGEDKVLVLSVCIKGQDDRRFLIVSKLEEKVLY